MREKEIQDEIIAALQNFRLFKTAVWRNNTGVARYSNPDGSHRFVRFGHPGSADITGIAYGRRLDIEVKQPGKKQTTKQKDYESMIKTSGGIYFVAESLDDAVSKLQYELRYMQKCGWASMVEDFLK